MLNAGGGPAPAGTVAGVIRPLQGRYVKGGLPSGLDKLDPRLLEFGLFKASKAVRFKL